MRELRKDLHEENRKSWNAATRAHNAHKIDQAGYLRRGGSTLFADEIELLGNVAGQRLLHLCCNAGQDTLSLARLGADVVGVDISDEAIDFATRLSAESGIPARFERADVYDWLGEAGRGGERFDVVFCSYGAICWLSDLERWAQSVARVLGPGGRLVVMEFHPYSMIFDDEGAVKYPYFSSEPYTWDEGIGDYVGASKGHLSPSGHRETEPFENPYPVHEFLWTLGDIVSAISGAGGMRVDVLREYPYSNGCGIFGFLVEEEGRRFVTPPDMPDIPLMYGLVALL